MCICTCLHAGMWPVYFCVYMLHLQKNIRLAIQFNLNG